MRRNRFLKVRKGEGREKKGDGVEKGGSTLVGRWANRNKNGDGR